jgi:hypothetical protein
MAGDLVIWLAFFLAILISLEEIVGKALQLPGQPNGNAMQQTLEDLMPESGLPLNRHK